MKIRVLQFKLGAELLAEVQDTGLYLSQIEDFKIVIAEECNIAVDDIEVESIMVDREYSKLDVTVNGLVFFDESVRVIEGLTCILKEGSDMWLDAMNDGSILDKIGFTVPVVEDYDDMC